MDKICKYQEIQGNHGRIARRLRCCNCGVLTEPTDIPVEKYQASHARVCSSKNGRIPVRLPNILYRLALYAGYLAKPHRKASAELVLERFSICSPCEFYNDSEGACGVCGCFVNLLQIDEGFNKLADENESCPLGPTKKKWNSIPAGR